jgi:hypothetical protein
MNAGTRPLGGSDTSTSSPFAPGDVRRWEWIALGALLLAALGLRLFALDRIPSVVIHDECDNLVNAFQILHGKGPAFFGLDWKPQPAASVHLQSVFLGADRSLFALRLPAALFSVVALIPFYALLRKAAAPPAALLASALLATDIWYLHFSRAGWENVYTCVFLLAAALLVRSALRTGRSRFFVAAGVAAAFGAYGYTAGLSIAPAVAIAGALALLQPRVSRPRLLGGLLLAGATTLLLLAPQVASVAVHSESVQGRMRNLSVLGGRNEARSGLAKVALVARKFVRKGRELFATSIRPQFERGDRYLRFDGGPFARPTAYLLGAGMIVSVLWIGETWLWWVFLLVPFFLTQALVSGSLNGARGVIFVPVLYLFVGLALHGIWLLAARSHRSLGVLIVAAALLLSAWTTREYFAWVQSAATLEALDPAIPVAEFPAWRDHVWEWTARNDGFFNLDMWEEQKRRRAEYPASGESSTAREN